MNRYNQPAPPPFPAIHPLTQIGPEGAESLAAVLETNKVLQHLALNNCAIGDRGLEALATGESYLVSLLTPAHSTILTALCRNRTLVTLEVGTNGLTDVSAQYLGGSLKLNFKLEGLSLWQNDLSGQGAQRLAEGLQV